ncbi:Tn3 family transposase [Sulfobacillus harzensis]|uniref:Tn3 family transposase n=1 Tax=Sulfobacillus harzensis TaxID=2729629 RepID=A0A7Y0L7R4_9FIRM|nr:Tn3 family transposase [Sulfobacillus harzensis]
MPTPVNFLTEEQAAQYGRYAGDPSPAQLAQYFYLDDTDRQFLRPLRGDRQQLGWAVQLGTLRFLGTFVEDWAAIPPAVVAYVAGQLNMTVPADMDHYGGSRTRREHALRLTALYGYSPFEAQPAHWRLVRWLYQRAWLMAERPSVLFDRTTAHLVEQKILLPGVTTLTRLVAQVRDRAQSRLWRRLAALPHPAQRDALDSILAVQPKTRLAPLDILRRAPTRPSIRGFQQALDRLDTLRALGAVDWNLQPIPSARLGALARHAATVRAQAIARMPEDRRLATLVAFTAVFTIRAHDDLIELLERYLTELLARTQRRSDQKRLRTLRDLDAAARALREACAVLLQDPDPNTDLRATVFARVSKEAVQTAIRKVDTLTHPPDQTVAFQELWRHYPQIRQVLPRLLAGIAWQATPAGQGTVAAWEFLREHESQATRSWPTAPTTGMTAAWRTVAVDDKGRIGKKAYTFWVLSRVLEGVRSHDLYVTPSERYGDPRAQLLQGAAWDAVRPQVLRTLNWAVDAESSLRPVREALDAAYRTTAAHWETNPAVRLESFAGKDRLVLSPLDRLEDPPSLRRLRTRVAAVLPRPTLPDLLLEVHQWTGFADAFTHVSQGGERIKDLALSVCAVLLAQACNIGLDPVVHAGIPALEYDRLTWVGQNYVRAETLAAANATLVDYHAQRPLARIWGQGEVASADGLRFVVPVRSLHAGPNPKYFGAGRGVTYYNFTSDQFSGFNALVIAGTLRDSLRLLEGVLDQHTGLNPHEIMTDTAGYSDLIFGLFGLLGYQFSPRLADIGEARFWRWEADPDYGVLNRLARQRIRADLIIRHWDDMLRVAGSLKWGTVNATALIQALQHGGRPTLLGRAIGELGRIYKTRYLLAYLDDESYRRRILTQLNRGEARHGLARAVFYGKRGELHQAYREGQEDQLNALGLVVNAIVLWNTRYMEQALDALRRRGQEITDDDVVRLSPLGHDHITMLGHYSFEVPDVVAQGHLRPLSPFDE